MKTFLFKEALESIQTQSLYPGSRLIMERWRTMGEYRPQLVSFLKRATPFVISDERIAPAAACLGKKYTRAVRFELDIPFENVFFEAENLSIIATEGDDGTKSFFYGVGVFEQKDEYHFYTTLTKDSQAGASISLCYVDILTRSEWEKVTDFTCGKVPFAVMLHAALAELLEGLRSACFVTQQCTDVARIGQKRGREYHKINRVVRVVSRQNISSTFLGTQDRVDWKHRWEVMGHWRKVPGVGRDRNGEPNLKGITWVKAHVRGPENMPLVRKVRFVAHDS